MCIMDAELGENNRGGSGGVANTNSTNSMSSTNNMSTTNSVSTTNSAPLPLPDAAALDWAALVHTATRAMLQVTTNFIEKF